MVSFLIFIIYKHNTHTYPIYPVLLAMLICCNYFCCFNTLNINRFTFIIVLFFHTFWVFFSFCQRMFYHSLMNQAFPVTRHLLHYNPSSFCVLTNCFEPILVGERCASDSDRHDPNK